MKNEIDLCNDLGIRPFSLSRETMELLLRAYNLAIEHFPYTENSMEHPLYVTGYNDAIEDAVDTIAMSNLETDVSSLKKREKKTK